MRPKLLMSLIHLFDESASTDGPETAVDVASVDEAEGTLIRQSAISVTLMNSLANNVKRRTR